MYPKTLFFTTKKSMIEQFFRKSDFRIVKISKNAYS